MGIAAALAIRVTADTKAFETDMAGLGRTVESSGGRIGGAAMQAVAGWKTLATVVTGLGIGETVGEFVDAASSIADMSAKTGIGVRELQKLQYAGDLVGISLEQIASASSMLQNRLAGGDKSAAAAMRELGLNTGELLRMDPYNMLLNVGSAIQRIPDPARQTALAMDAFGRSGATMLPAIRAGLREVGDEADRLNILMSDEGVSAGDALGDAWTTLGYIGNSLISRTLTPFVQILQKASREMRHLSNNTPGVPGAPSLFGPGAGVPAIEMGDSAAIERELMQELKESQRAAKERAESIKAFNKWLATGTPGFSIGLSSMPGQQLPMPQMPIFGAMPAFTGTQFDSKGGLWGLTSLPGTQMPMPTLPQAGPDPDFFRRAFGGDFGKQIGATMLQALTGGGDLLKSAGGLALNKIGESLVAGFSESFGSSFLGKMLGGILPGLGAAIGPLIDGLKGLFNKMFGNAGRDLVKDFAAGFGGFDAMHEKLLTMGDAGEQLWIKLTQGVGRNNPEQAKKVIEEVTKAMEAYKQAVSDIIAGTNARAANVTDQNDLNVVGAGAMAAFQLQIQQGVSAVAALQALTPAITAMKTAMDGGNLTLSAAAERLLYLHGIVEQNKVQFDNLAASGQILTAMLQGNIRDGALFAAVSFDIGQQIQSIIDKGVPTAQVFALAQPQLQALWEAQTRWGFAVDETTQALLTEAETQGFVGEHMRSANEKILQVLIAIGDVLGAKIPDALRGLPPVAEQAASGVEMAFAGMDIKIPVGYDFQDYFGDWPDDRGPLGAPAMASGGYVPPRSGGTLVRLGEGGEGEHVIPDSKMGGVTVHVHGSLVHQDELGEVVANAAASAIRTNRGDSYTRMTAALGL